MKAILALADGTVFEGEHFGATGETSGEVVFNTSMTGYQEILTDPSYKGQIVTMTYPLIGNYGCNEIDVESIRPQAEGFVVREYSAYESNWRSQSNLGSYLEENEIIGIHGIDTRALTKRLRVHGVMDGVLSTEDLNPQSLVAKAQAWHGLVGMDMVQYVTCPNPYLWETHDPESSTFPDLTSTVNDKNSQLTIDFDTTEIEAPSTPQFRVIAVDFGVKYNILRQLTQHGCQVQVVPAHTSAEEILDADPDGIFLSNGPGDPEPIEYGIKTVRQLIGNETDLWYLLGASIVGTCVWWKDLQAQIRTSRCKSTSKTV